MWDINLDNGALLETVDSLELGEVVQHLAVKLERKTSAVARIFTVHQKLMNLLD